MAWVHIPEGSGTERSRLWQSSPVFAAATGALNRAVYDESVLPLRERELVRLLVARVNGCPV